MLRAGLGSSRGEAEAFQGDGLHSLEPLRCCVQDLRDLQMKLLCQDDFGWILIDLGPQRGPKMELKSEKHYFFCTFCRRETFDFVFHIFWINFRHFL